jgi:hypothetical protein
MSALIDPVMFRLAIGLERYAPLFNAARAARYDEGRTRLLVEDFLADVLGFDRNTQLSAEYLEHGACCDLALQFGGAPAMLIEVRPAGSSLDGIDTDRACRHAVDQGCSWFALTNGSVWHIHRIDYGFALTTERVLDLDLLALDPHDPEDLDQLALLTREGWLEGRLAAFDLEQRARSPHAVAASLLTEPVLRAVQRQLERAAPGAVFELDEIALTLCTEILSPEVLLGDPAEDARRLVGCTWFPRAGVAHRVPLTRPYAPAPSDYDLRESPGDICS